jgi:PAS domain S-box-containing protein
MATILTAMGSGPFSAHSPFVNAALLDVLFTVLAVSGLALAAVIAERERAEAERERLVRAQMAMESRLPLAAIVESSNDAILSLTLDGFIVSWNAAAQRIFGFTAAEAIGQPSSILAPPGLRDESLEMLRRAGTGKRIEPFETVRVTKAGQSLHVSVTISPLRDEQGRMIGAAKIVRDISERKKAEEALANVSRRLIEAQEQERSRIARELHDDIGQRLALLAVSLDSLKEGGCGRGQLAMQANALQRQASEVAADVQALSHRLHSSRLELLGLASAMRHFCEEFARQQKATVDFESHALPVQVPADVSLCLFRILQEGLHNAAKHSGVRRFEVLLWGARSEIHLLIRDGGRGFDLEAARSGRGLGLVSMEERIKLLGGDLSIRSQPDRGTTIRARVRLAVSDSSQTRSSARTALDPNENERRSERRGFAGTRSRPHRARPQGSRTEGPR